MANEITVNNSVQVTNGNFKFPKLGGTTQRITQNTVGGGSPGFVSVGTAEEAITIPDVTTLGWAFIKNCDATNYITYGPASGGVMVPLGRLKAGEEVSIRLEPGITLRAQANTAAVKIMFVVFED